MSGFSFLYWSAAITSLVMKDTKHLSLYDLGARMPGGKGYFPKFLAEVCSASLTVLQTKYAIPYFRSDPNIDTVESSNHNSNQRLFQRDDATKYWSSQAKLRVQVKEQKWGYNNEKKLKVISPSRRIDHIRIFDIGMALACKWSQCGELESFQM